MASRPREGEDLLALAQEAGGLGIFEWQIQIGAVRLSPKLQTLYGLSDFDGRFESWLACLLREDVVRVTTSLEEAFAARNVEFVLEFRICRPGEDSPRWMETRNVVFYDNQGNPERLVAVSVDVTERKRATIQLHAFADALEERVRERTRELEAENEARAKAEESLRQAQKMEAVGQLTGGVAHDFNNLLTVVMGGLEMIERQLPALPRSTVKERIARATAMAREGADRAARLTARLLAFARQQPLSPRPIDPKALISGIADMLRRTIGEAIGLEIKIPTDIWNVQSDFNQLENALLNLAVNARDAMPERGRLTIEATNRELDDTFVDALEEPISPGQYVMIAVTDTGSGMDKATIERAFEPFFTTKEVGKGTGLGLSQVYGFVRQSSGHVRIESEPGVGSTIRIYLPRAAGPASDTGDLKTAPRREFGSGDAAADDFAKSDPPVSAARKRAAAVTAGSKCILVVEDDHAIRAYTAGVLQRLGYNVLEAENASAAVRLLRQEPRIELLFTDIVMPGGMNGRQLAETAQAIRPELKVLFTTGYSRRVLNDGDSLDHAVHVIGKPFSFDTLARTVRTMLNEIVDI